MTIPAAPQLRTWGSGAPTLESCELVVVSWNMHKEEGPRFEAELAVVTSEADLVLLQESTEPGPSLPPSVTQLVTFRRKRDGRPTGVATASAVQPTEVRGGWSPDREPLTRTPKSALVSTLPLPSGPALVVVNLHGINFRGRGALDRQLRDIERVISDHSGPMIVAGDFNTWSAARRRVADAFAQRLGLRRSFTGKSQRRLDRVLVRGLAIEHTEVRQSRASDHDALRVRLRPQGCT